MGYYRPDCFNQPEKFDLEIFKVIEGDCDPYGFNEFVVWRHIKTNKLYWAIDYGCSCPTPWEWATSIETLSELDKDSFEQFDTELDSWGTYGKDNCSDYIQAQKVSLEIKILRYWRDNELL